MHNSIFSNNIDHKKFWDKREILLYLSPLFTDWHYVIIMNTNDKLTCFELFFFDSQYLLDYLHFSSIYLQTLQARCFTLSDLFDRLKEFVNTDIINKNNSADLLYWKSREEYDHNPVICHSFGNILAECIGEKLNIEIFDHSN